MLLGAHRAIAVAGERRGAGGVFYTCTTFYKHVCLMPSEKQQSHKDIKFIEFPISSERVSIYFNIDNRSSDRWRTH